MAQPAKCPDPGIAFFDDFSWRSFVALVWPAGALRGRPNPNARPGHRNQVPVFQTYKADWETFQPGGSEPSEWFSYYNNKTPCGGTAGSVTIPADGLQLTAFSKFGNVRLAKFGGFVGPLVSQNKQYTRFLAAFNQAAFDNMRSRRWYRQEDLRDVKFRPDALGTTRSPSRRRGS